jgi:hypothetical protein
MQATVKLKVKEDDYILESVLGGDRKKEAGFDTRTLYENITLNSINMYN